MERFGEVQKMKQKELREKFGFSDDEDEEGR